ncbi:ribbon-helix-helix domain-containing protein [Azospirillum sp. B510]|uniref:ribbon-helix-helix domain-containing protein n=1 Tax=Azospirillum sp. (strain B510) TaxID=137722 RepID=UPI000B34A5DD|nr:ribbon-helix-helix domain-containing protein [Azospirillum sp. B510]
MLIQKKIFRERSDAVDLNSFMVWPEVSTRTIPLVDGRTKLRLEAVIWSGLDDIAREQRRPVQELCRDVDASRTPEVSLTSAIRNFVLDYYRYSGHDNPLI